MSEIYQKIIRMNYKNMSRFLTSIEQSIRWVDVSLSFVCLPFTAIYKKTERLDDNALIVITEIPGLTC